jgi:hypothetical protein
MANYFIDAPQLFFVKQICTTCEKALRHIPKLLVFNWGKFQITQDCLKKPMITMRCKRKALIFLVKAFVKWSFLALTYRFHRHLKTWQLAALTNEASTCEKGSGSWAKIGEEVKKQVSGWYFGQLKSDQDAKSL